MRSFAIALSAMLGSEWLIFAKDCKMEENFFLSHIFNDEEGLKIHAIKIIDKNQREQLSKAKRDVLDYAGSMHVARAVVANRNDLLEAIISMASVYLDRNCSPEEIMENGSFDFSRMLANLCSMFRSFLDHTDRYFLYEFGKLSPQYSEWRRLISSEYDKNFSYKLMYLIRNYIQHYDMPPIALSIKENIEDNGIEVRVDLQLDKLMEDPLIKRKLALQNDLDLEDIPLVHMLDSWDDSFNRICNYITQIRMEGAVTSARYILKIRSELNIPENGRIAIIPFPVSESRPSSLKLKIDWMPENKAELIIEEFNDSQEIQNA